MSFVWVLRDYNIFSTNAQIQFIKKVKYSQSIRVPIVHMSTLFLDIAKARNKLLRKNGRCYKWAICIIRKTTTAMRGRRK